MAAPLGLCRRAAAQLAGQSPPPHLFSAHTLDVRELAPGAVQASLGTVHRQAQAYLAVPVVGPAVRGTLHLDLAAAAPGLVVGTQDGVDAPAPCWRRPAPGPRCWRRRCASWIWTAP
ncbi:hypothetical protein ACFP9V_06530 [Deinococcus radiopugnans]|uniref:hypothetical protein n=1 Tax=Deinococcus radiopugnans TaxID=57497 RepID=UPI003612AD2E